MKTFWFRLGTSGDARNYSGQSPTFIIFTTVAGSTTAPGITEVPTTGGYYFNYEPSGSLYFEIDGGALLADADRYFSGALDPLQTVDERVGSSSDSFGSTAADPSTIFGQVKRNQEFNEGNAVFNKTTGKWDIYSRGSSTLLVEKQLTNSASNATKT